MQASVSLNELSTHSAAMGQWSVCIHYPRVHEYTYLWNGERKVGQVFRCVLTSAHDSSLYVVGEARNDKKNPNSIQNRKKMFLDKKLLNMSKVSLKSEVQKKYVHSPFLG